MPSLKPFFKSALPRSESSAGGASSEGGGVVGRPSLLRRITDNVPQPFNYFGPRKSSMQQPHQNHHQILRRKDLADTEKANGGGFTYQTEPSRSPQSRRERGGGYFDEDIIAELSDGCSPRRGNRGLECSIRSEPRRSGDSFISVDDPQHIYRRTEIDVVSTHTIADLPVLDFGRESWASFKTRDELRSV